MFVLEPLLRVWAHAGDGATVNIGQAAVKLTHVSSEGRSMFFFTDHTALQSFARLVEAFERTSGISCPWKQGQFIVIKSRREDIEPVPSWMQELCAAGSQSLHEQEFEGFGKLMRLDTTPSEAISSRIAKLVRVRWNPYRHYLSVFARADAISEHCLPEVWSLTDCTGLPDPIRLARAFREAIQPHLILPDSGIIAWDTIVTPKSHGGVGLVEPIARIRANFSKAMLPMLLGAEPIPAVFRSMIADYWRRWFFLSTASVVSELDALWRINLSTVVPWRAHCPQVDAAPAEDNPFHNVATRLLDHFQHCSASLIENIDWESLSPAEVASLPLYHHTRPQKPECSGAL